MDRVTGKRKRTETENQLEAAQKQEQDRRERLELQQKQKTIKKVQRKETHAAQTKHTGIIKELESDIKQLQEPMASQETKPRSNYAEEQRNRARKKRQQRNRGDPTIER